MFPCRTFQRVPDALHAQFEIVALCLSSLQFTGFVILATLFLLRGQTHSSDEFCCCFYQWHGGKGFWYSTHEGNFDVRDGNGRGYEGGGAVWVGVGVGVGRAMLVLFGLILFFLGVGVGGVS